MTLLAFVIVLGVLVLVHEWGHFIVARMSGVRVETFSIGFGPTLASIDRGDTHYKIGAIPLGGYVKMAGDEPGSEEAEAPDAYYNQPLRNRAAIVLAGPMMNFVLAFALAPVMYLIGVPEPVYLEQEPRLGWVMGTADEKLDPGQVVEQVDGRPVATWRELMGELGVKSGEIELVLATTAGTRTATVTSPETGGLLTQLLPPMDPVVERVMESGAAAAAGLEPGDRILRVGGEPIDHWMEIREHVDAAAGGAVTVVVGRGGEEIAKTLTPQQDEESGRWLIGVARQETERVRTYGPLESVKLGSQRVVEMIGLTFRVLGGLFSGNIGLDALGGPIMIAQGAGEAARAGVGALLTFMIFISVQLAVLNLLPIPVLDGGHLLIMALEAVFRRPIPDRWVELAQWMGLGLLILLMLYVTRNDIMRIWGENLSRWFGGG